MKKSTKSVKSYYAYTKVNAQGYPVYLTVKSYKGQPLYMFTGNIQLSYTFESEQEAFDFYNAIDDSNSIKLELLNCEITKIA